MPPTSSITLLLIAAFTLLSAMVALSLRNIIRSAVLLVPAWLGIAAFYLWAGTEFVAFAQVLVYVGAISMVVLFAVVLTRHSHASEEKPVATGRLNWAAMSGGAVAAMIVAAILTTSLPDTGSAAIATEAAVPAGSSIKDIGLALTGEHAAAVLITGALLTLALLGSILLAATEKNRAANTAPTSR